MRTFWIGPPLSQYEILSLKSFAATGAHVVLYSDQNDLAVPDGVELRDAAEVLPGDVDIFRYANGEISWARHSDLFRYIMLERFGGWYADLDIVCLADRLPQADLYFPGGQNETFYSGVLKFPQGSPAVRDLIDQARHVLSITDHGTSFQDRMIIGPPLLKKVISEHGLMPLAAPQADAYEIPSYDVLSFFDPARCDELTSRLAGRPFTHLWNEAWNMLRIPRALGPPENSFLDILFRRFGIPVSARGRLQYASVASWVADYRLLKEVRDRTGTKVVTATTIDKFADHIRMHGWQAAPRRYDHMDFGDGFPAVSPGLNKAASPQTLRTFWHGDSIGPYQLLCLKSFADYGHHIEVFTYSSDLQAPDWLAIRRADEILPADEAVVTLPQSGQVAVHADLFRYALLEKLGGWWIEPDVMLMKPDLPSGDVFAGTPNLFGQVPTAVLRFPPQHPAMKEALVRTTAFGKAVENWSRAGAPLLTELLAGGHLRQNVASEPLGPITWLSVPDLFDPAKADELTGACAGARFLHLQGDVWRRAGVPQCLGPPAGSLLDVLLVRHRIDYAFGDRMEFSQLNRWIRHMYRAANVQ